MLFLSVSKIREAERRAMEDMPSISLIKNAALACYEQIKDFNSVRVYCGKGNNGSDGYATALLLKKNGKKVEIVKVYEPSTEDCINLYNEAVSQGIPIVGPESFPTQDFECVLDAIFGIGISGELCGSAQTAVRIINSSGSYIVSADVPSGMNADTGKAMGECVVADKTVTFTAPKRGMLFNESVDLCGEIVVCDVGIAVNYGEMEPGLCVPINDRLVKSLIPKRKRLSHKGSFGTAVIIAGSQGMAGAAAMAAEAAYRSGCGLVKIIAPESICTVLNILIKEAVVIPVPEERGVMLPTLSEKARETLQRADSVLVGCGIGQGKHDVLISNILSLTDKGVIIDADGINALRGKTDIIKNKNVLLTPHPLEFSRISGIDVTEIENRRIQYASKFSREIGVSVLLKGARTVVAYGGSNNYVSLTSTSALAKAGSGDVLAGIIVSLAAQGLSLTDSAAAGCYIHSSAGVLAEREKGAYGTMSSDFINLIPKAIENIGKQ